MDQDLTRQRAEGGSTMKVAVASMGTVPEALVGIRFGTCSQFLVFDLETMSPLVVSVPPRPDTPEHVSLAAIRALAKQDVSVVITGNIKDICRTTLEELGIEVISGVQGMTVLEAVERYRESRLAAPASRQGALTRIAVASEGEGLEARLRADLGTCTTFTVVDPQTRAWETVRVEHSEHARVVSLDGVRAIVRSGAAAVITAHLSVPCLLALQALAVPAYAAPAGITVREAIERYERGELEELASAF
jgi:predicted Fe-Mo cluster-binding NifX family protein